MTLKKGTWFIPVVCLSLLAMGGAARAADNPSIEPRAERILKAAIANLHEAKSYRFRGEMINDILLPGGSRMELVSTVQGAVRRPDRAWTRVEGEGRKSGEWYDGKTFTHLDLASNAYASWAAPATIDELLDKIKEKLGFVPPMAPLLRGTVNQEAMKTIQSGVYVGEAVVGGVPCSHLVFKAENVDWQIYVEKVVPVIKRFVIVYKKLPGDPKFGITFTQWDFNTTLPDFVFAFDPPPGATKVEFEIVQQ